MNASQMINFGAGYITLTPSGTNPTPVQVGILQDVSIESSVTLKSLYGSLQFPADVASAERKLSGKAKSGLLSSALYTNFYTGSTAETGSTLMAAGEAATVPSPAASVTVLNSATWVSDLGVYDTTSGVWLARGAVAASGIYTVSAGVYTFASPQATHTLKMYYDYTQVGGQTISITNQLMGSGTVFGLTLYNSYQSKTFGMRFPSAIIGKLSSGLKNNDHTLTDIDFEIFADSTGNVAYKYFGQ